MARDKYVQREADRPRICGTCHGNTVVFGKDVDKDGNQITTEELCGTCDGKGTVPR